MALFKKTETHEDDTQFYRRIKLIGRETFLIILGLIVVVFIFVRFSSIWATIRQIEKSIQGIIFGIAFAYLIDPIVENYKRGLSRAFAGKKRAQKLTNAFAIGLGVLTGVALVALLFVLIIPGLIDSISMLLSEFSNYTETIQEWITHRFQPGSEIGDFLSSFTGALLENLQQFIAGKISEWGTELLSILSSGLVDFVKTIVNFVVGIIICVYLLRDKKKAIGQLKKAIYGILNKETADELMETCRQGHAIFSGFIHAKIIDSLIIGLINLIFCLITQMPYGLLVSAIVCITNMIPFFGPLIGAIPTSLLILLVDPVKCLIFVIFTIVLQQIDGNVIGPHLIGNNTNLNEFWVTFAIMLFGGLFGFLGMLVGVPVFGILYYVIARILNRHMTKRGMPTDSGHYQTIKQYDDLFPKAEGEKAPQLPESADDAKEGEKAELKTEIKEEIKEELKEALEEEIETITNETEKKE